MLKSTLAQYYVSFKEQQGSLTINRKSDFEQARLEAKIIKALHGVEKGLCLEKPRLGFGVSKINAMLDLADKYIGLGYEDTFCLKMLRDALKEYLEFHKEQNYTNEKIKEIEIRLNKLIEHVGKDDEKFGGYVTVSKGEMDFSIEDVEKLIKTRHSVREFSGEKVEIEEIEKAIELAKLCPSACNRQCARVYYVSTEKYMQDMKTNLEGIGGFADDAQGFLLVCGKRSAYGEWERNQYIVSAAIFAGYLSLTLHALGIAACTVQRSVSIDPLWEEFREKNNVPKDEQIVVMFAIGKYKEMTKVPISKRFPVEKIFKEIK